MDEKELNQIIEKKVKKNERSLHLVDQKLTSLPESIGNLINLRELHLSGNQLISLPESFGNLTNLIELDLSSNQLTSLPESFRNLTNLTKLNLFGNQLTALPEFLGNLTNLMELHLSGNKLTALPESLGNLNNLTELYLSGNKLTALPESLGNLTDLKRLVVLDNPLISPPIDILERGSKFIIEYLRELKKKSRRRYEAKLLMLGDGGEGKTCVSRALRGLKFQPQVTTRGVDVVRWTFANPNYLDDNEKEITLNIWDFEGQEIHHQTHQFFMSESSLCVLVFKCREIFRMDRVEYWLDTIRARAPKSQVLLVITECEERTPYLQREQLKANYGDLFQSDNWFFAVECETDKGIPALRDHLQRIAANMEMMGRDWPASYSEAEKEIEQKADENGENVSHITRNELYGIFQEKGISESSCENVENLMGVLGIITHFPDWPDLRDFIVLKPQWLTKAISFILEDKQLEADKGNILHTRMHQLWENQYPGLYTTFHNCMKEFELCYDLEDSRQSLVPLRFGYIKPNIPWSVDENAKERRVEYKLTIRPPFGLMSRFIVKTHHMIAKTNEMPKGVYWHNGVFLRTGDGPYRSEALCEFDNENKTLSITVRAAFPQNMIEQLHGIAKAVFSFYKGIEPERYYGCVKLEEEKEKKCEGNHSEKRILFALSRDKSVACEIGWHEIDPTYLVYGFSSFGQFITKDELRKALDEEPEWAKELVINVLSSIQKTDDLLHRIENVSKLGEQLQAEFKQELELGLRNHLIMIDQMLDNREFNSAPALIAIVPQDRSK